MKWLNLSEAGWNLGKLTMLFFHEPIANKRVVCICKFLWILCLPWFFDDKNNRSLWYINERLYHEDPVLPTSSHSCTHSCTQSFSLHMMRDMSFQFLLLLLLFCVGVQRVWAPQNSKLNNKKKFFFPRSFLFLFFFFLVLFFFPF